MKKLCCLVFCVLFLTSCSNEPLMYYAQDEERVGTVVSDVYYGEFFEMTLPGKDWFVQLREDELTAIWPPDYDDPSSVDIYVYEEEINFDWFSTKYSEQQTEADYKDRGFEEVSVEAGEPETFEHDGLQGLRVEYNSVLDGVEQLTYQWLFAYRGGHIMIIGLVGKEEYKQAYEDMISTLDFYNDSSGETNE